MGRATRVIGPWLGGMLIVCLVAALIPGVLLGGEAAHASPETVVTAADLGLTVHEGLLSLTAQDASLTELFDAIGQQLSIEVVARIPTDERITLACAQLSLAEALKRLRPYVNYLAMEDTAQGPGIIRTLIVVSKRAAGAPSRPTTPDGEGWVAPAPSQSDGPTPAVPGRPKPFRFEFDPAAVGERGR